MGYVKLLKRWGLKKPLKVLGLYKPVKKCLKYLGDLVEDAGDAVYDFIDHLTGKPGKLPKRIKKGTSKKGRPAYHLSEQVRGVINLAVGATIVYAAVVAATEGVSGLEDLAAFLVQNMWGRAILLAVGVAYITYGLWKIVMGGD